MFVPRAVQLGSVGSVAAGTTMATPDVAPVLVAYLRKRRLTKTLKAFIAETSFKDAEGPIEDDLEAIYGHYMLTKTASEKRKNPNVSSELVRKKVKLSKSEKKAVGADKKQPDAASSLASGTKGVIAASKLESTTKKLPPASSVKPDSSSSSEDSDSSSGEEEKTEDITAKSPGKEVTRAVNGTSKQANVKLTPAAGGVSSFPATKQAPGKLVVGQALESSSEDSESDSEEGTPMQIAAKIPENIGSKLNGLEKSASSSSETSDSSCDEKPRLAKVTEGPKPTNLKAKAEQNVSLKADESKRESSSSEGSDSDSDGKEKTRPVRISEEVMLEAAGRKDEAVFKPAKKDVLAKKVVKSKSVPSSTKPEATSEQIKTKSKSRVKVLETAPREKSKTVSVKKVPQPDGDSSSEDSEEEVPAKDSQVPRPLKASSTKESEDTIKPKHAEVQAAPPVSTPKSKKANLSATKPSGKKRKRGGDVQEDDAKPLQLTKESGPKLGINDDTVDTFVTEEEEVVTKRLNVTQGSGKEGAIKFFQKINVSEVKYADPRLQDNSYWAKNGAEEGWGAKAQMKLQTVKGKGFRHEKTKKKRGSYKGGSIDFSSHSIKFQNSDDE